MTVIVTWRINQAMHALARFLLPLSLTTLAVALRTLPPCGPRRAPRTGARRAPPALRSGISDESATASPVMPPPPYTAAPRACYVHLPFCRQHCHYCDFPIVAVGTRPGAADAPAEAYVEVGERGGHKMRVVVRKLAHACRYAAARIAGQWPMPRTTQPTPSHNARCSSERLPRLQPTSGGVEAAARSRRVRRLRGEHAVVPQAVSRAYTSAAVRPRSRLRGS